MKNPRESPLAPPGSTDPVLGGQRSIFLKEALPYLLAFVALAASVAFFLGWHIKSSYGQQIHRGALLEILAAGLLIILLGGLLLYLRRHIVTRERERTEHELRRLNRALLTISGCNQVLVRAESEPDLLSKVCETLVRVGGYRMAWVGFAENDAAKSVRPVSQAGFEEGYLQAAHISWADTERGQGPTGRAIRNGKVQVARDIQTDLSLAPWREEALRHGYASSITLPLFLAGQVLGGLMVYAEEADAFDSAEVALLTELAGDVAYGVQALRTRAEHQRAEEALHLERAFTESIIDSLPDSFFIVDSAGRYVRWNKNAGKALGFSPEEFAGMDTLSHVAEDDRPLAASKMQEALTKGHATADFHLLAKDGRKIPYLMTATRAVIDDKIFLIGIGVDISERKQAEESLALLKHSIDLHYDGAYWTDSENRFIYINDAGCKSLGYEREELIGKTLLEVNPKASPQLLAHLWETLRGRGFFSTESVHRRKDGSEFPVEIVTTYVQFGGREFSCGFARDITERKRTEEALTQERHLLHSLMDNLPDRIYFKDRESRFTRVNKALAEQFGLSDPGQAVGKTDIDFLPAERAQRASHDEREIIRTGRPIVDREGRVDWPDGHVTWLTTTKMPLRDPNGNFIGTFGISHDITQRKLAEEALRDSEGKYRSLVSNIPDVAWTLDANLGFVFISRNIERMSGFSVDEVDHHGAEIYLTSLHPDDVSKVKDGLRALFAEGRPYDVECRVRRKDGEWIWVHDRAVATYEKNGIRYADGLLSDITERKRAEASLRESEERFRTTFENAGIGMALVDLQGRPIRSNPALQRMLGYGEEELSRMAFTEFTHPADRQMDWGLYNELAAGKREIYEIEKRFLKKGGGVVFGSLTVSLVRDRDGCPVCAVGMVQDITERERSREELYQSRQMVQTILDTIPQRVFWKDKEIVYLGCNQAFAIDAGLKDPAEIVGKNDYELAWKGTAEKFQADDKRVMDQETPQLNYEETQSRPDGSLIWTRTNKLPLRDREGKVIGVIGTYEDITEHKRAEAEHVRLVTAIEQSAEAVVITNPAGTIEYVNPAFTRITGYSREEALGQNPRVLKSGKHDPAFYQQLWETILKGQTWHGELTNQRKDGGLYTEQMTVTPVRDEHGQITHFIATKQDVTERLALEAHLHQSSKMEAVGRLAGGVAHDFNNLLTVINGYSQILMEEVVTDAQAIDHLKQISNAGERAASLTRQLLAFSRHQVLAPQVLDLNSVVSNLERMLRRLIGEDIKLHTLLSPSLSRVKADPGQIEQVIMNLAVNARDAMPKGGRLAIETSNVELDEEYARNHPTVVPGPHVVLVVSDTGEGMTPETQARIFEPFFTTKEMGQGTGLGLATVYGIVKQSGGSVWVYSEAGQGTTFKIYFPVVHDGFVVKEPPKMEKDSASGTETVLVVEDEEGVRSLVRLALVSGGYNVLESPDAASALAICTKHNGPIHLLLTDVVMPQMSGPEVASKVAAQRPGIRVLYMSGYTDDAVVHHGVLTQDMPFIQKPFSPVNLRKKVREVLGGSKG